MTAPITEPATQFLPPPSAAHATEPDGEGFIWQPRPGVVAQKATGVLSFPLARLFGDFFRPILVPGAGLQIFDDFEGLMHYTKEARELLGALTLEHRDAIQAIHFLICDKEMALGISAFKHAIGDPLVHTYFDRASFVQSYEAAIRRP